MAFGALHFQCRTRPGYRVMLLDLVCDNDSWYKGGTALQGVQEAGFGNPFSIKGIS